MKLIIAGSRKWNLNIATIQDLIDVSISDDKLIEEVVSGACRGVDKSGENWAEFQGVPIKRFKAGWSEHGNSAGPIRNKQMAEYADALLVIFDGMSPGSSSMEKEMIRLKKPVYCVVIKKL